LVKQLSPIFKWHNSQHENYHFSYHLKSVIFWPLKIEIDTNIKMNEKNSKIDIFQTIFEKSFTFFA